VSYLDKFVSLYHLDNNALDAIGSNNGSETFAAYTTDAAVGPYAFAGDGVDKRINIGNDSSLDITANISLGGLIKPNASSGYTNIPAINKINTYYIGIGLPVVDEYGFAVRVGASFRSVSATGIALDTSAYHAVIGTYDNSKVKIFIDGILRGIFTQTGPIASNPTFNTVLAAVGDESTWCINAKMDELFIANDALTDGGVTTVGNAATGEVEEVTNKLLAGTPLTASGVRKGNLLLLLK
jgi:hypothetical protein